MLVTIFADASWCPETHAGGWAGWAKSQRLKCEGHGQLRDLLPSSNAAEISAIGNAVHMALRKCAAVPGDELLIQSDCMHAISVLGSQVRPRNEAEGTVWLYLCRLRVKYDLEMKYRHVPGHTKGDQPRLYVNNLCDERAKAAMREKRDLLRNRS